MIKMQQSEQSILTTTWGSLEKYCFQQWNCFNVFITGVFKDCYSFKDGFKYNVP